MSKEEAAGQMQMHVYDNFVVPEHALSEEVDSSRRIQLAALNVIIGQEVQFGRRPPRQAFHRAQRTRLEQGLYIPGRTHYSHLTSLEAEHDTLREDELHSVVRLHEERSGRISRDYRVPGVVFQPKQFKLVAHHAEKLGEHSDTKAIGANGDKKLSEQLQIGDRAGGHTLTRYIAGLTLLSSELESDNEIFRSLLEHIYEPSRHRMPVRKLNEARALFDDRLHSTIATASINLRLEPKNSEELDEDARKEYKDTAIEQIHKVARRHLYDGRYSPEEREMFMAEYLKMIGLHNVSKGAMAALSLKACQAALGKYQQELDRKATPDAAAHAATT